WDCSQHLDQSAKDDSDPVRQEILCEKDRDRDPDAAADQEREERAIESAPDLRQYPKGLVLNIPAGVYEKGRSASADGRQRLPPDLPEDVDNQEIGRASCRERV